MYNFILTRTVLIISAFYLAYKNIMIDRPIIGFISGVICLILATLRLEDRYAYFVTTIDEENDIELTLKVVSIEKISYSESNYKNFNFLIDNLNATFKDDGVTTHFKISKIEFKQIKKLRTL